jgi:hypothetical protein
MPPYAIVVLVVVGVGVLFLEWRYGLFDLARLIRRTIAAGEPVRIRLAPVPRPRWHDRAQARQLVEGLRSLGFEEAGAFRVLELPGIPLQAFMKPELCAWGIVYEVPLAGAALDLVTYYRDGTSVTYCSSEKGSELRQRPGHPSIRAPGLDAAALFERFLAERPAGEMKTTVREAFPAAFERAYADGIDWRNSLGGPTEEEIRGSGAGARASEQAVRATMASRRRQALAGLQKGLIERYLEASDLPPEEQARLRPRLVAIHDRLAAGDLLPGLRMRLAALALGAPIPVQPARQAFRTVNDGLVDPQRFQKVGEVAWPIEAEIYCAPEGGG